MATDVQCKLVLVGNGSVGKTSIVARFTEDGFARVYKQTIGVDFFEKRVELRGGLRMKLQVWDIGGQSLNSKMLQNYITGAGVIFLCYDVTDLQSFSDLEDWLETVRRLLLAAVSIRPGSAIKSPVIHLLGNKADLMDLRRVTKEKHAAFIADHGLDGGIVCSAQNGENVTRAFYRAAGRAAGVELNAYELAFLDRPLQATISRRRGGSGCGSGGGIGGGGREAGEDGSRAVLADRIEAEDRALEAAKAARARRYSCTIT
ncbi:unnamed protein product [Phaeothamnion confervicola]